MEWNDITEQIKMFLAKRPNAPFDIRITNRIFDPYEKDNVKADSKVIMKIYLQPEEKDNADLVSVFEEKNGRDDVVHKNNFVLSA